MLVPIQRGITQPIRRALLPQQDDANLVGAWLNWKTALDGIGSDYSANGNNGIISGSPATLARAGVSFDGTDDKIDFGDVGNIQQIDMWIKPSSDSERIVLVDTGAYIHLVTGTVTYVNLTASATYVNSVATTALATGEWQHLVCQFTQVDANNLELGWDGSSYGDIDVMDFRAYDELKTTSWITLAYRAGVPDDALVGHWFDSGMDKSRFGLDLAPQAGAVVGHDIKLNGTDEYLYKSTANWRGSDEAGTIMAWVKRSGGVNVFSSIVASGDEGTNNYHLIFGAGNNAFGNAIYVGAWIAGADSALVRGSTAILAGIWHYVAWVSTETGYLLYVDGQLETPTIVAGGDTGDWFADVINRDNIAVGATRRSSVINYFNGSIRVVRVYSDAKSADYIKAYYESTRGYF